MKLYYPSEIQSIIGKQIMYRHIASETTFGPVVVVACHEGSNNLIVSNDSFTGRTFALLLDVTLIELYLSQGGEVQ